jgi:hypothetical protein
VGIGGVTGAVGVVGNGVEGGLLTGGKGVAAGIVGFGAGGTATAGGTIDGAAAGSGWIWAPLTVAVASVMTVLRLNSAKDGEYFIRFNKSTSN